MRFNIKALALGCAILWGGATLLVGLANLIVGGYGQHYLDLLASIYPGYNASHSLGEVALVTVYAIADGLIGGVVFGWLYNLLAKPQS